MTRETPEQMGFANEESAVGLRGAIECLGMTFESDDARRAYFLELLRQKLADSAFRAIEGFPIGSDEDILRLSDPPYYTACPNPFLNQFAVSSQTMGAKDRVESAFANDISKGRSGAIYDAHSYPTKVPPEAIAQYILHYTKPGDTVLDGFCGTGMTGVAAQMCAAPPEDLRISVNELGKPVEWGVRRAVLCDLSPFATFISANLNLAFDPHQVEREARAMLQAAEQQIGWVYRVPHKDSYGEIQYTIWSDMFRCPSCLETFDFWTTAVDLQRGTIRQSFLCPHCSIDLKRSDVSRVTETILDPLLGKTVIRTVRNPVLINYSYGGKRYERTPTAGDLEIITRIEETEYFRDVPNDKMMHVDGAWGDLYRAGYHAGISHVHQFYTHRNLLVMGTLWRLAEQASVDISLALKFLISSYNLAHSTLMTRIIFKNGNVKPVLTGYQSGVLYIGSIPVEKNILSGIAKTKLPQVIKSYSAFRRTPGSAMITTQSTTSLKLPAECIDYIFVDPPFGENIKYSEGNFIAESWLRCFTFNGPEAIISAQQHKRFDEYRHLMEQCFQQLFYALKPGRWMTVEFHNSQNKIWNLIQESILRSGFIIADVSILNKQQSSFKQITAAGAVKQDLVISAYKPDNLLEDRFQLEAGTVEGAWDFIRCHLLRLPVVISVMNSVQPIAERMNYLLFDRMVAFHIQRGVTVPLSASEFYTGLDQRFPERDQMYFLPEQAVEYDRKRLTATNVQQLDIFIIGEASAIQWLRQELIKKPRTFQELHAQFTRELNAWQKHEQQLELSQLLEENFLRYAGVNDVPTQIHSYLSSNFHDLRGLEKSDPNLQARARDRYYVPDPSKAGDIEKLREKALLREFETYRQSSARKLKEFRLEAVRAGFKKAWQERDYATILAIAAKIPEDVLQEDPKLLMWYDQAVTRSGRDA